MTIKDSKPLVTSVALIAHDAPGATLKADKSTTSACNCVHAIGTPADLHQQPPCAAIAEFIRGDKSADGLAHAERSLAIIHRAGSHAKCCNALEWDASSNDYERTLQSKVRERLAASGVELPTDAAK